MGKFIDLTGREFWDWTVIERAGARKYKNTSVVLWKCQCKCGNIAIVAGKDLRQGKSKRCLKCAEKLHTEFLEQIRTKHGGKGTRLYTIWGGMKQRCYNPNNKHYKDYGGRGITICDEWKDNFVAFEKWALNNGYRDDLSIDRKDGTKGYSPGNCRWATNKEQCNNLKSNILITYNGETKTAKQWSEDTGILYETIIGRYRRGKTPEEILKKKEG